MAGGNFSEAASLWISTPRGLDIPCFDLRSRGDGTRTGMPTPLRYGVLRKITRAQIRSPLDWRRQDEVLCMSAPTFDVGGGSRVWTILDGQKTLERREF